MKFGDQAASPSDDNPSKGCSLSLKGATAMGALHLDGLQLGLFLAAAFFGGLTSGLSGFAMGLVVSGVWLHIITPDQNATLIVFCGLVTQGYGIWRVRHAMKWRAGAPVIIWGATCVSVGPAVVSQVRPE